MASKPPPLPPKPPHLQLGRSRSPGHMPPPVPPKPPGLIGVISQGFIESVAELGSGGMNPIWLVALKGGNAKIVLKLEAPFKQAVPKMVRNTMQQEWVPAPQLAKANIQAMSNVMGTVSPTATMDTASPSELNALAAFGGLPESLKSKLADIRRGTHILLKMKYDSTFASMSNGSVESGRFSSMSEKEKDEARKILEAIRGKTRVWQNLGSITIADALLGNSDRFDISNGGGVTNFGNMIFSRAKDGTINGAMGHDAVDPSKLLEKQMFGTNLGDWEQDFGVHIKNKHSFISFAEKVIQELNKRRMNPLGIAPFGHAEQAAFAEGMVIGWDKLANKIGSTVRMGKGIPSGLMARAKYLGWVK